MSSYRKLTGDGEEGFSLPEFSPYSSGLPDLNVSNDAVFDGFNDFVSSLEDDSPTRDVEDDYSSASKEDFIPVDELSDYAGADLFSGNSSQVSSVSNSGLVIAGESVVGGGEFVDSRAVVPASEGSPVSNLLDDDEVIVGELIDEVLDNDLEAVLSGRIFDSLGNDSSSVAEVIEDPFLDSGRVFTDRIADDHPDADRVNSFRLERVLSDAIDKGASDVHMITSEDVVYRILGDQVRQSQWGVLGKTLMDKITIDSISNRAQQVLTKSRSLDASYTIMYGPHAGRRCRLSVGHADDDYFMVFRVIADQIPTVEELELPDELIGWTELNSGLVLMNGPTGSGKSTTLASLVQRMLDSRSKHIITLERPIEYLFSSGKGTIIQREVGQDVWSFKDGLTSAMRGDPDIIMVGEVRNKEEVDALLEATETGHLTISTLHANSAATAIKRISGLYSGDDLKNVLGALATVSRGFANQLLIRAPDGSRRYAIRELLRITPEVSDLIEIGDSKGVFRYMQERGITMEHELLKAVNEGKCTVEEARSRSDAPFFFDELVENRVRVL